MTDGEEVFGKQFEPYGEFAEQSDPNTQKTTNKYPETSDCRTIHKTTSTRSRFQVLSFIVFLIVLTVKFSVWPWEGTRTTPDSLFYIAAAQSFLRTGSLGSEFIHWPPLFPLSLSLFSLIVSGYEITASYFNAVILVVLLFGCRRVVINTLASDKLAAIFIAVIAFSPSVELVFEFLWSEPEFILLSFFCLYFLSRYLVCRTKVDLGLASLLLMFTLLTRHMGASLGIALLLSLFCFVKSFSTRKLGYVVLIGFLSALPYFAWILRTWFISQTLTGTRVPTIDNSFSEIIFAYSQVIAHWCFPHFYFIEATYTAVAITATILLALIFLARASYISCKQGALAMKETVLFRTFLRSIV